jgi:hypothetical protein
LAAGVVPGLAGRPDKAQWVLSATGSFERATAAAVAASFVIGS